MKKYLISFLVIGLLLVPAIAARAQTDDNAALIAQLRAQIETLRQMINQLLAQRTPVVYPGNSCFGLSRNLRPGDRDEGGNQEISKLQSFLKDEGLLTISKPTGYYGKLTAEAVRTFKEKYAVAEEDESVKVKGEIGPKTRARIEAIHCTRYLRDKLRVLSPNGGETLVNGKDYVIRWTTNTPMPLANNMGVISNWDYYPTVDIYLNSSTPLPMPGATHGLIAEDVPNTGSYNWSIPIHATPGSYYGIQVCYSDVTIPVGTWYSRVCDSSDGYFTITDNDVTPGNQPPSISSVSGPTTLNVNQTGTWQITASDPENGSLRYSVTWGDEYLAREAAGAMTPAALQFVQEATFTHTYSYTGVFKPTFVIQDDGGRQAVVTMTVRVGQENPPAAGWYITPSVLPAGFMNSTYGATLSVRSVYPTLTGCSWNFAVAVGQLPPGLTLTSPTALSCDASSQASIIGVPTIPGDYQFTVEARSLNNSITFVRQYYQLRINLEVQI